MPKKVATVINVEPKVWFANERTWLAYLSIAVLLASLSGTLFAGSGSEAHAGREKAIRMFGSVYGVLCVIFLPFCLAGRWRARALAALGRAAPGRSRARTRPAS